MTFFSESLFIVPEPKATRPQCGACGLLQGCVSPKMAVQGAGAAGVMLVADAPDIAGDGIGVTWGGSTGAQLRELVRGAGLVWDRDLWVTSALACRGQANGDRARWCRPLLMERINQLQPSVIILMGQYALQSVVGESFATEELKTIDEWAGMAIPSRNPQAWLCPVQNPTRLANSPGNIRQKFFEHHLRIALDHRHHGRPTGHRDYNADVHIVRDHKKAAAIIRAIIRRGAPTAFDYECNMLKPENPARKIYSISICDNGERTIACPMVGDVIQATIEYLQGPQPKFGSNIKFEDRWGRDVFGIDTNGWAWDTMNMAHIIDNRPMFSSIKKQAFLWTGWPLYDQHIHQFFDVGGTSNDLNHIHKIDIDQLLQYNGVDSAVEFDVAFLQMQHLQHPLFEELFT